MIVPKPVYKGASPRQKMKFVEVVFEIIRETSFHNSAMAAEDADALVPALVELAKLSPVATEADLHRLSASRRTLLDVLGCSSVGIDQFFQLVFGSGHSLAQMPKQAKRRYAALAPSDLVETEALDDFFAQSPWESRLLALQLLNEDPITPAALRSMNASLALLRKSDPVTLPLHFLGLLCNASFMAGYATLVGKYEARQALSALATQMLAAAGYPVNGLPGAGAAPKDPPGSRRPRALVLAERFTNGNDLYRCFASAIESMKEHFDVVLVADQRTKCPQHAALADKLVYIDTVSPDGLSKVIKLAADSRPDLVFYPSVGMTPWTYALAHMRLALIQVASTGTPGPVGSPAIDYQAFQSGIWASEATQFERPVLFEAQPQGEGVYDSQWFRGLPRRPKSGSAARALVVGINSSAPKLNAEFLDTLRAIANDLDVAIALEFFPSRSGLEFQAVRGKLAQVFPEATIHQSVAYRDYVTLLSGCDIILQSFPFGGTNTTLEALLLGIPILCMAGCETHSTVDMEILRRGNLDTDLLASSRDDYARRARALINDADLRKAVAAKVAAAAPLVLSSAKKGVTLGSALRGLVTAF